jgi:antitoxin (DNA-binding transcriptional repressor) of toxin-antitoxin stability system
MKTVGVRELKNRLSEYLRQARAGEKVLVTDRGQVIAELSAPGHGATDASVPAGLLALARRDLLVLGAPVHGDVYPPFRVRLGEGARSRPPVSSACRCRRAPSRTSS